MNKKEAKELLDKVTSEADKKLAKNLMLSMQEYEKEKKLEKANNKNPRWTMHTLPEVREKRSAQSIEDLIKEMSDDLKRWDIDNEYQCRVGFKRAKSYASDLIEKIKINDRTATT